MYHFFKSIFNVWSSIVLPSFPFKGSVLDPLHPDAWLDFKGSISFCLDSEVLREEE